MTGSHVVLEEADDTGEDGLQVTRVIVNGVDVGRLAKAPKIHVGTSSSSDLTTITLTLIPGRLTIKGEHADGDHRETKIGFTAKII
ncbi:hypothetical protein [Streptomyces sp. NTK 937]|uniref:hypothetical protein n=1 Tax=Streptomyces sp. NTK 937 TaxID=1487711 RepID=UPI0004A92555|nr:hypothetical protein [Streptomyces sp. NTK 937]KDQ65694.1 hypothetical protein DT87_00065 [Streptomyces sp. NTK 937]KDQ65774.1 hypothetical protein DT87_00525 [Streptomyces sp. NTK 937]